jgi:hypothetical protein
LIVRGITNGELEAVLMDLGYRKTYFADFGTFGNLETFVNHAFIWRR